MASKGKDVELGKREGGASTPRQQGGNPVARRRSYGATCWSSLRPSRLCSCGFDSVFNCGFKLFFLLFFLVFCAVIAVIITGAVKHWHYGGNSRNDSMFPAGGGAGVSSGVGGGSRGGSRG